MRSVFILLTTLAALLGFVVAAQEDVPQVDRAKVKERADRVSEAQAAWDKMPGPVRKYFREWRAAVDREKDDEKRTELLDKFEPTIPASTLFAFWQYKGDVDGVVIGKLGDWHTVFQVIDEDNMLVQLGESERLVWIETPTKGIEPDDKYKDKWIVALSTQKREYKNIRGGTRKALRAEIIDPSPWLKFKDIWLK